MNSPQQHQGRHLERRLCEVRDLLMSPVSLNLNAQEISPDGRNDVLDCLKRRIVNRKTTTNDNKIKEMVLAINLLRKTQNSTGQSVKSV